MGAALIHKRELVAEMIKEAKANLEREGWGESRTMSVKIRIHKDLRFVTSTHTERIKITNQLTIFKQHNRPHPRNPIRRCVFPDHPCPHPLSTLLYTGLPLCSAAPCLALHNPRHRKRRCDLSLHCAQHRFYHWLSRRHGRSSNTVEPGAV
jgi:hypothetical protein